MFLAFSIETTDYTYEIFSIQIFVPASGGWGICRGWTFSKVKLSVMTDRSLHRHKGISAQNIGESIRQNCLKTHKNAKHVDFDLWTDK
jgi:hypothetical protein